MFDLTQIIIFLLAMTIIIPFGAFVMAARRSANRANRARSMKTALAVNIISFFATLFVATIFVFSGAASAADAAAAVAGGSAGSSAGMAFLAAGLSTGLSCVGAGIAVSASASAAIGALSENEGLMGKALIFVALAEGIAIYGLIISIMILGRV